MPFIIQLPFGISVDLSFWANVLTWPVWDIIKLFFAIGGWVVLALVFFYMASILWADYRKIKGTSNWKWVILAIDIPEELVQSPKAVEQAFAHFSGSLENITIVDKYWKGKAQKFFSLEVISIEGYIQFLIRCEEEFRDLVEAAVYAQYPAAEVTEVEDYVQNIPDNYPNQEYDIFGLEFGLVNNQAYPIRTYEYFEHSISKDSVFHDPMGSMLENFSRIGVGENFWMQIVISPVDNSWKEAGIEIVKEVFSQKAPAKKFGLIDYIISLPFKAAQELQNIWDWNFEPNEEAVVQEERAGESTPGTRIVVEAIENKISKVGFKTKIRVLYIAKKNIFNPSKCVNGFVGSMNQFYNTSQNGIQPVGKADSKKGANGFVNAFKQRNISVSKDPFILNVEELATLWHFPLAFIKTPLVQKISSKKAEPPTGLPLESSFELPIGEDTVIETSNKNELVTDIYGEIKTESDSSVNFENGKIKTDESKFDKDSLYG